MDLDLWLRRIGGLGAIALGILGVTFSFVLFGSYGILTAILFVLLGVAGILLLSGRKRLSSFLFPLVGVLATLLSVLYYFQEGFEPAILLLVLLAVVFLGTAMQKKRVQKIS